MSIIIIYCLGVLINIALGYKTYKKTGETILYIAFFSALSFFGSVVLSVTYTVGDQINYE